MLTCAATLRGMNRGLALTLTAIRICGVYLHAGYMARGHRLPTLRNALMSCVAAIFAVQGAEGGSGGAGAPGGSC